MNEQERNLAESLEDANIAMLTTPDLESRPLVLAGIEGDELRFLVDDQADWMQGLTEGAQVGVTFSDAKRGNYVALVGSTRFEGDGSMIKGLWSKETRAHFDGPDDPRIRVLCTVIVRGRYWDSPDTALGRLVMLARTAGSERRESGDVHA